LYLPFIWYACFEKFKDIGMAIAPTGIAKTSLTAPSSAPPQDPKLFAAALIQQFGGKTKPDYGKIVGQLEALQQNTDPTIKEFGHAVEREIVSLLGGGKPVQTAQVEKALKNATYIAGGQSFSRSGNDIEQTRTLAAKAPNKDNPNFVKYMEYDRAHGDGKWATNDSTKINEAWRNMIVAGARTPSEYAKKVGAMNDNWTAATAQFNTLFSGASLSAMADKAMAGLTDGYNFAASALSDDGSPASVALRMAIGGGNATEGAFKLGLAKGVAGAAGDLIVTLGKIVRFAVDANPVTGIAGDISRELIPDSVKNWANSVGIGQVFDAGTPSYARGMKTIEGIADVTKKVTHYFATHSKLEIQVDIAVALAKKWESIKGEYNAMSGDPVKQAEWLGKQTGAVLFEVASSFIPVAGVAGKAVKGTDVAIDTARGLEKLDDVVDAGRVTGKIDDIPKAPPPRFSPEIIQQSIRTGIKPEKVQELLDLKKAGKELPDPSTYMTKRQIAAHLAKFDDGIVRITSRQAFQKYGTIGPTPGFSFPKSELSALIKQTGGDLSMIEKKLGLDAGTLSAKDTMIVVIERKSAKDLSMPSGNERGANDFWLPGGITSGGISEATLSLPKDILFNEIKLK
jgi:hypothetical protein